MTTQDSAQQPIGYWLNRTDQAITTAMNRLLEQDGITRVGWQLLNVLNRDDAVAESEVYDVMQANADSATLAATIERLIATGWVVRTELGQELALTDEGKAQLARIRRRIGEFRQQSLQGVSEDDYRTMIAVLERIINNLM
jgi:DNA-binding MarR family transcriptional regulator